MSETEHEQDLDETPQEAPLAPDEEEETAESTETPDAPQEGTEGETEAPQAQGPTQEDWEKRFQKAERYFATYTKRVSEAWEEDAVHLTALSLSPSAPPGFIDLRDAGRIPDEIKTPVLEFLGFAREQDYEPDPQTSECRTCKGKGKTKTGSHVPNRETRACPACNGSGAEGLGIGQPAAMGNGELRDTFTLAPSGGEIAVEADNWGEPKILPDGRPNPNWGRQPQFKELVEPYGITANLTAQDVGV
jgi:hypothetical protein